MATLQSNKSNQVGSKLVSSILMFNGKEKEVKTSTLYLAAECADDMQVLLDKLLFVKNQGEDSMRKTTTAFWQATAEGEELVRKHAALKAIPAKQRTKAQRDLFADYTGDINGMHTKLERAAFTYEGAVILKSIGRIVDIDRLKGGKSYVCYVRSKSEKEFTKFTGENLRNVSACDFTKDTPTEDILALVSSVNNLPTPPNAEKGANGTALTPAMVKEAVVNLDTTIANLVDDKGNLSTTKVNVDAIGMLWARADAMLTKEQKAAFRKRFADEGAAEADEAVEPAKVA